MTQSLSLVMFRLPCWPCLPDFLEFSLRWRIKVPDQFGNCQSQVIALCQSEIVEADSADTQSNKGLIRDTTDKSLPNLVVKFLLFESIKSQISFLFSLPAMWGVGTRAGFNDHFNDAFVTVFTPLV